VNQFVELLISGVSIGFVYALIVLGFVLVFKATRVVNFAHGSVLLIGAYVIARTHRDLGFLGAIAVGVAVAAAVAFLIQFVFIRRVRGATTDVLTILTLGVNILLATEMTRRIGDATLAIGDPWRDHITHLGSFSIPQARVAAAVVAVILLATLLLIFRFTDWGLAMRSAADDGETAALMGIRLTRVAGGVWALAGAVAAIGGIFLTTFPTPGVDANTGLVALAAFPAAILGGLDSVAGAVIGGLIIGVTVTLVNGYQDELAFLGRGLGDVAPYIVMLVVLLVRPSGLFGTRGLTRV
jgi:branched-chain amino acid transport system permease protein